MSASDPSGAEMRSPNVTVGVQIDGKTRGIVTVLSGASQETVRDAALANVSLAPLLTKPVKRLVYVPDRLINIVLDHSEVSPRSSGGAPMDDDFSWATHHGCFTGDCPHEKQDECLAALNTLVEEMAAEIQRRADYDRNTAALDSLLSLHEKWEVEVSALQQEAATLDKERVEALEAHASSFNALVAISCLTHLGGEVDEYSHVVDAVRQEAETLTRQRDAAIREISVIAREAETLRKQLGEAVQAADDANQEEAFVRRALDYQALDYEALSREAETLRSQLDAAQKALGTEQTMHRAWRKRAEEAEAERTPTGLSAELTPLTDEQRDAFDDFVRASLETDKEVIAKLRRELLERNFPRAARVAVPREPT